MLLPYSARYLRTSRIGALETLSRPLNGLFISSIKKNPLETAEANKARLTVPVAPCGANSPKQIKMMVAHTVSTTINGTAVELLIPTPICTALICSPVRNGPENFPNRVTAEVVHHRWSLLSDALS